jgi:hypothetical protein
VPILSSIKFTINNNKKKKLTLSGILGQAMGIRNGWEMQMLGPGILINPPIVLVCHG